MTVVVLELRSVEHAIGELADDGVTAGDVFRRRFRVVDDDTGEPADFTGFTPSFQILGTDGSVIETGTVEPSSGDDSGEFIGALTASQTALATIADVVTAYRLRIDDSGGGVITTHCGPFYVKTCKAPTS